MSTISDCPCEAFELWYAETEHSLACTCGHPKYSHGVTRPCKGKLYSEGGVTRVMGAPSNPYGGPSVADMAYALVLRDLYRAGKQDINAEDYWHFSGKMSDNGKTMITIAAKELVKCLRAIG